ncbi:MAG: hypothetical protein HC820_08920 [Hydrococcus sp. RM1_1_31]|nr:hypothetical protein [Hydrococcus sp. RM1_1_31]
MLPAALQVSHQPIATAIDKIFESNSISQTARNYQKVAEQIVVEILKWMKKPSNRWKHNRLLRTKSVCWGVGEATPMAWFAKQWYYLTNYLKEIYFIFILSDTIKVYTKIKIQICIILHNLNFCK